MTKKGQVTLFIIIGIVILISAVLFFMLKGSIQRKEIAPGVSMIVEELPSQFLPVQPFVEKCLEKTSREALEILGQRGGYIYTDKLIAGSESTVGNSVSFSRQSDLKIPYWFHLASDNKCTGECDFKTEKLALKSGSSPDSVEDQLARYVEENLGECIDDFKSIKELDFDVKERGKMKAKAIVAENNVVVQLDYPISVSRQNSEMELNNFYTTLNLDLVDIYEMADYITGLQRDYRFIEKAVLNLIIGFSGKDKRKLPPMSDSSFEIGSKVRWMKSNVRNNVRNVLTSYIPLLRVMDTPTWREIDTSSLYIDKLYNYGMSIPNNSSITNLGIYFNYLDFWDIYFDLNCNGEICEPESAFTDFLPIGIQRYNFAYDVSFPVLVEIQDSFAFNEQGYSFNFMLESNIRNNRAMPAKFEPLIADTSEGGTMLCDESKRTSGKVKIEVYDSLDDSELNNVEVIYTCIDSCYIGETENGVLDTSLPVCFGGALSFRKEGYETVFVDYDAYLGKNDDVKIYLNPEMELKVELRKKLLVNQGGEWKLSGVEEELLEHEYAAITLSKSNYNIATDFNILELKQGTNESASFSEGLYEIDITLISDEGYYIPPETRGVGGEELHFEEFNASSYVGGKTKINYTFTKEDLSKDKLVLSVLAVDLNEIPMNQRSIDDLEITSRFNDYTIKYYYELIPELE